MPPSVLRTLASHLSSQPARPRAGPLARPAAGSVQPLAGATGFGAELVGFDFSRPQSEGDMRTIVEAFEEHSLVLFRDTHITDEMQVAFSRQFAEAGGGVLEVGYGNEWEDGGYRHKPGAPAYDTQIEGSLAHSEDAALRAWEEGRTAGVFVPDARQIRSHMKGGYETRRSEQNSHVGANAAKGWQEMAADTPRNTGYGPGNALWHTDSSFKLRGSLASILLSHVVPASGGGQTDFASMRCAYADLPAEQQKRLEGVVGVHDFSWSNGLLIRHWAGAGKTPGQPPARHYGQKNTFSICVLSVSLTPKVSLYQWSGRRPTAQRCTSEGIYLTSKAWIRRRVDGSSQR